MPDEPAAEYDFHPMKRMRETSGVSGQSRGADMASRVLTAMVALAAGMAPLTPAQAEFYTFQQLRDMCRGEVEDAPQFRTQAANQLLSESYRTRCRMYLLGMIDTLLIADPPGERRCELSATEAEVTEPIVETIVGRNEAPEGGVAEIVREMLSSRFGCELRGTALRATD